jgi:hypothetical protein
MSPAGTFADLADCPPPHAGATHTKESIAAAATIRPNFIRGIAIMGANVDRFPFRRKVAPRSFGGHAVRVGFTGNEASAA